LGPDPALGSALWSQYAGWCAVHPTKDGLHNSGTALQALYGSYNRQANEFEHGGYDDRGLNWYVTGNGFKENGWRDDSPSRLGQIFGKLGRMDARTYASLSVALANTKLNGLGLQEVRPLDRDYNSVYTKPDETKDRSGMLNLAVRSLLGRFAGDPPWDSALIDRGILPKSLVE